MSLEELKPTSTSPKQVAMYAPYCQSNDRSMLAKATGLYQQGKLEGERKIERREGIPFVVTWDVLPLPTDLIVCRLHFQDYTESRMHLECYELMMPSFELVNFLIHVLSNYERTKVTDLPQGFYRKLLWP